MNAVERVLELLGTSASILVASHVNPDGDSVGASLGLSRWLRSGGHDVMTVFLGGVPSQFSFLPDVTAVVAEFPPSPEERTVVVVDTPSPDRTGAPASFFDSARAVINIDHHPSNTGFGDAALVDTKASSASLLVHELIGSSGASVDARVATLLYAGVLTDTGGFRFSNTDARTFDAAARLVRLGADAPAVARHIYGEQPPERLRLLGMVLASLESELDGRLAVMTLTDEMRARAGATGENIEGLASYGHLLEGVEVSMLLREQCGRVRVSLRSSGDADVNEIAARLGGGGHRAAAGVLMDGPFDRARQLLVEAVRDALAGGST